MNNNIHDEYDPTKITETSTPSVEQTMQEIDQLIQNPKPVVSVTQTGYTDPPTEPSVISSTPFKYFSCFMATENKAISTRDRVITLPSNFLADEDIEAYLNACIDAVKGVEDDAKIIEIGDVVEAFKELAFIVHGSKFESFFSRNVGKLVQSITGEKGAKIRINHQMYDLGETEVISGKAALRQIRMTTGTGKPTKIPLWHSGIVLLVDPFTEKEMTDLNVALSSQQLSIGRKTRGAAFTGDDIHVVGIITEFILAHVADCNIKDHSRTNLNKYIKVTDIPALFAGALAAIYPNGYPVHHVCVNVAKKLCNYTITAKKRPGGDYEPDSLIDFTKVLWVNSDLIGLEEETFMSAPMKFHTVEQVEAYQLRLFNKLKSGYKAETIWTQIDNPSVNIQVAFKVPSIAEYSRAANQWIDNIKRMAEEALQQEEGFDSVEDRTDKRNRFINAYSRAIDLGKHVCWVDYIVNNMGQKQYTISDSNTIKDTIESFIQLDGVVETFERLAQQFKENNLVAWTGFNNFECPVCHSGQTSEGSQTPSLIPVNMVGYFFTIMVWKRNTVHQLI